MNNSFDLKLENIKYIRKNENKILFEILNQQFYIIVPEKNDEFHFVELPVILNGFSWISKVNEFIFEKNPNLQGILTFIENKYNESKQNKSKQVIINKKVDIFNVPDLDIDVFDLEERKLRRQCAQCFL